MNQSLLLGIIGAMGVAIVGALTALATYLVSRRQTSGSVATSDAATLWEESQAMRKELREEVISLRKQLHETNAALESTKMEMIALREEIRVLRMRLGISESEIIRIDKKGEQPPPSGG